MWSRLRIHTHYGGVAPIRKHGDSLSTSRRRLEEARGMKQLHGIKNRRVQRHGKCNHSITTGSHGGVEKDRP